MTSANRDAYRHVARWYDQMFGAMNAGLRGIGLKMFPPQAGMEVLDAGCGTGIQLASYQHSGCRVTGIDASPAMLQMARHRLGQGATLTVGDAAAMPYPDQAFALVLAATVLHEMPPRTRAAALDEMKRVLRPGGSMLLIDFEAGPARPVRGCITRGVIAATEAAAGRSHHRNYRDFMAHGGLPPLLEAHGISVSQRGIVSGGAIGLYLPHMRPRGHDPRDTPQDPCPVKTGGSPPLYCRGRRRLAGGGGASQAGVASRGRGPGLGGAVVVFGIKPVPAERAAGRGEQCLVFVVERV